MEILVLLGIFIVLLSIFIPYGLKAREDSRRTTCSLNLYEIRNALQNYRSSFGTFPRVVHDTEHPDGYAAFTGPFDPDPFAPGSAVSPNDVTASLWLLVRYKLVTDPKVFVCPSSSGYRDMLIDAVGKRIDTMQRSNFRSPANLSYSYASPFTSAPGYRFDDTGLKTGFALMADKNPGVLVPPDAAPNELVKGNSPNHGHAGQSVLYVEGNVSTVERTPYCGPRADNIYSARADKPSTQPSSAPTNIVGFIGRDLAPVGPDDSYLVPTALDQQAWAMPATTRPVAPPPPTTSATPTSTSAPSTTAP
jgi:type II secretory pathway pseudopilin PulG